MAVFVDKNVIRLDIAIGKMRIQNSEPCYGRGESESARAHVYAPMNEAEVVNGFDGKDTFGHVETRHVLRESVILDEHCHEIAPGKELHDEVEIGWVLKRIEQLDDPWRIGFREYISLCTDVSEL